jgi:hypothetical protein
MAAESDDVFATHDPEADADAGEAGSDAEEETPRKLEFTWVGFRLPGRCRMAFCTYEDWSLDDHPPVTIPEEVKDVTTLDKLKALFENKPEIKKVAQALPWLFRSPTSCYFDMSGEIEPSNPNVAAFYRDQQDCVIWCFDSEKGYVVSRDYDGEHGTVYARSLPEFLARLALENGLWFKSFWKGLPDDVKKLTEEEARYLEGLAKMNQ